MKKTYIVPSQSVERMDAVQMIAVSLALNDENPITNSDDILTKESNSNSIWDNEW